MESPGKGTGTVLKCHGKPLSLFCMHSVTTDCVIKEYICIYVMNAVIGVKVAETSNVVRHLYIKEHSVTDTHPCKPNGRTLLVLNVPPYVTEVKY